MPRDGVAKLAALGVGGIALTGGLGVLEAAGVLPGAFSLDDEYTVPALYSAALLMVAAFMVFRLAQLSHASARSLLLLAALFLAFVSLDEVFWLHERLDFQTGIDWQVLYLPPALAFAWALWRTSGELGRRGPEALMIAAALAMWVLGQMLEAAAWSDVAPSLIDEESMTRAEVRDVEDSLAYHALAIPEELLEMGGSLLFAIAFARAVSRRRAARD